MTGLPASERLFVDGPAGPIQALIETPLDARGPVERFAVVCHPHPLYGGTLENKVVWAVARACVELGMPAIRFNFRGVGSSAGSYDEGRGETEDAEAVVGWARSRWTQAAPWLAGFSFGGAVAIRAAARVDPQRLIAVSPAVRLVEVGTAVPRVPWLVIQGDADDVVPLDGVAEWVAGVVPQPTLQVVAGAGHFFHGRLDALREAVLAFGQAGRQA